MLKLNNIFYKQLLISLTTLIALAFSQNLYAENIDGTNTTKITLSSLIREALKNNPTIKHAKFKWEAAIEKIPQAGALPDPMFSLSYFPEPIETKLGPNDSRITFSQNVPYLKKLTLKEDLARFDVQVEKIVHQREIREVITALSESYFELLYIDKAIEITRQNKDILQELTNLGTADYAADSTSLNDVLTAQSQLAQLHYDFILLTELRATETAMINSILSRPPDSAIINTQDISAKLPYGLSELYEISAKNLEELRIIDTRIAKSERAKELSVLASYPDFKFDLIYSQIGTPDGTAPENAGQDSYGFTIGVTLPIWSGKNDSLIKEKSLQKLGMVEAKKAKVNATNSMISNLYFKMNNSKRLMELYKNTLIPQAQTTMAKAKEWYEQKNSSFSQLLETQSVWLNFNLAYHRAAADYNKYAVRLQNLLGITLIYGSGEGN